MELTILTPQEQLYAGSIQSVKVPGTTGQFQILKGHAPIVSSLEPGMVHVVDVSGNKHSFEILRGFVEVYRDDVNVLAITQEPEGREDN